MFDNLTPTERILSYTLIGLVPIALLFGGMFWFLNKQSANTNAIFGLYSQISEEEDLENEAVRLSHRLKYLNGTSAPKRIENAGNDYQLWIRQTLAELQLDLRSLTPRKPIPLKNRRKEIGKRMSFSVKTSGDLQQMTQFLAKFYSVDLLHRINAITIAPETQGTGNEKKIRTGKLKLGLEIEFLALTTSTNDQAEFLAQYRELARSEQQYQDVIVRRNIFGPANNTPVVTVRSSSSYTSGTDVKVSVTGKDADDNDQLTFELLESSVDGAKLAESKPGVRTSRLSVPGQKEGKYEFKIKVTDDGFPAKSSIKEFALTFKDRKKTPPAKPKPKEPDFENARETRITSIVKESTGEWVVWIKVFTTGKKYKLKQGEAFELDKKQWVVDSISSQQAKIRVGERLLTFYPRDRFNKPRAESTIQTKASAKKPDSNNTKSPKAQTTQTANTKASFDVHSASKPDF